MGSRIRELGELGLISALRDCVPHQGIMGDDAAVLPALDCPVVTTDSFFEGTHFHRWWAPPGVLGRRLLEATISDIAAMGAEPVWIFAAICVDPDMEIDWLLSFYRGMSSRQDVVLAGGETVRGSRFGVTLTAIGEGMDPGTVLRRSSLRPGDRLWTGGPVGRALGAPELLEGCRGLRGEDLEPAVGPVPPETLRQIRAFLMPRAQVELGLELRKNGIECAIDISDGLFSEALHLCEESGVDIILEIDGSNFMPSVRDRPLEAAAAGEDFLLLFGAPARMDLGPMGCIPVGRAEAGEGELEVVLEGRPVSVTRKGYDHMEVDDGR